MVEFFLKLAGIGTFKIRNPPLRVFWRPQCAQEIISLSAVNRSFAGVFTTATQEYVSPAHGVARPPTEWLAKAVACKPGNLQGYARSSWKIEFVIA